MGKGMQPKKGYNQKAYEQNYDQIDWSKTRSFSKKDLQDMVVPYDEALDDLVKKSFGTDHKGVSPYDQNKNWERFD